MRTLAILFIGTVALPSRLLAQDRQPDAIYITGATQSGAVADGEGDVEWLRTTSSGTTLLLGGSATSFSDLWWTYGTAGGSLRRREAIYAGRVSLGGGRWTPGSFSYGRYVANVAVPVARGFFAETEVQHVHLAGTAATVWRLGMIFTAPSGLSLRAAYQDSPSAPSTKGGITARADVPAGRFILMGGFVATATQSTATDAQALGITTRIVPEYFGACTVPAGSSSLIVAAEFVPQADSRVLRLSLTLKRPLDRKTGSRSEVR